MKRVLLDENVPRGLRRLLPQFHIRTVQEEAWAGAKNGNLLRSASGTFDVLLTVDQRMRFQQNISSFSIGVVVIEAYDTTLPNLERYLAEITAAVNAVRPGALLVVSTA